MCEAFRQMEERGEKRGIEIGEKRGLERGERRGIEIGEKRGLELGEKRGKEIGENKLSQLISVLLKNNLINEIQLVTSDKTAREQYYVQYGIK